MGDLFTLNNLLTLGMLTLLQIVLGFDNLLYISLESKRAPEDKQSMVRKTGIGDNLVVGAPQESSSATGINGIQTVNSATAAGAAYLYTRDSGGTWSQQAYVKGTNTEIWDRFGNAVALSDDALVVAAFAEFSMATGINGDQTDNNNGAGGAGAVYVIQ